MPPVDRFAPNGTPVFKAESVFDPNSVIYSNVADNSGLGLDDEDQQAFRETFQGGLFNPGVTLKDGTFLQGGMQVHDEKIAEGPFKGRYTSPMLQTGLFVSGDLQDGDPMNPDVDDDTSGPEGRYSISDLISFQSALDGGSNYAGLVGRDYIGDHFDSHKDGTFSIKAGTNPFESFGNFPLDGSGLVHYDDEELPGGGKRTQYQRNALIRAGLMDPSRRDFSGGSDGGPGDGGAGDGPDDGGSSEADSGDM